MPVAFIGHGTPMNALESNRYTEEWRALGRSVPTPRAVLCVSDNWYTNLTAVTAMARPRTIHDFFGFPDELFAVEYPAPGLPELAEEVADLVQPMWVGADHDSWGIDHGTWSVLVHLFPEADVPVVQLSINATQPLDYHLALAGRLAPLRDAGVLIVGSGNVVHNLGLLDPRLLNDGADWAIRFDEAARQLMTEAPGDILTLTGHPDFPRAVPTPDHFIPLLYVAALADAAGRPADIFLDGYAMGSLSMTAYTVDGPELPTADGPGEGPQDFPDPFAVPPDQSNL